MTFWEKIQCLIWEEQKKEKKDTKVEQKEKYKGLINDRPHVTLFCGRKGSGKTQLCLKILKDKDGWRNVYQEIIIVSPTFKLQPCWQTISGEGITIYENFSEEVLEKIYNEQQPHVNSLLILDDNGEDLRRVNQKVFNKLVSNSRHLNISIVSLLQKISQSPTVLRSNCDTFAVFSACSQREQEILWSEIGILDKKTFQRMFTDSTSEQYSCFVASMIKGKLHFYKNFETEYK
jgi:hypothetical protein